MKNSAPKLLICCFIFGAISLAAAPADPPSAHKIETSELHPAATTVLHAAPSALLPERKLDGEDGETPAFDADAEEKTLSDGVIAEAPKAFTCADAEKVITCTDNANAFLTFKITYKVAPVTVGGGKKKVFYTLTVSNAPTEGQDTREFHGTFRVKFEKDEKGVNLKQKMAWLFGGSSNDLSRPNFLNDLKRLVPLDMKSVKSNAKVADLLKQIFASSTSLQGEATLYASGPCAINPQNTCWITLYPTDASYMRIQFQMGRSASNYAVPRSNFNEVFPVYAAAILQFVQREGAVQQTYGFPLNRDMAKALMVGGLGNSCQGCIMGSEVDQKESSYNLFTKNFVFPRMVKGRRVDEKYTLVGVYYNFEGWNYEHVVFDSEKEQEELLLNTNSAAFQQLFQTELVGFLNSNDYSLVNTANEVALTIEDLKAKITPLVGTCTVADGSDPATSFVVKCGEAEVIAVHDVAKETDSGFKIDFLVLVPKGGLVPDSGFVLQKVNSFDQVARIAPLIKAYLANVQTHLKSRWALV